MTEHLTFLKMETELGQSQLFGQEYEHLLSRNLGNTHPGLHSELNDLFNNILCEHVGLTDFQKAMLFNLLFAFSEIREKIDPSRLSPFQYYTNEDDELVFFRKTHKGVIHIVINPEDCIAYSYIGVDKKRILKFYHNHNQEEFEGLAYKFFI